MHKEQPLLDRTIGTLIKTTLVDFPERVACAVFFKGCNLRCPYCYNIELVQPDLRNDFEPFVTMQEICNHLEKRKNVLTGLVISGGEALLQKEEVLFLSNFAKNLGYSIKLDTNGTLPHALEALFTTSQTAPDYIAMDIKTSPSRYAELCPQKTEDFKKLLVKSIDIIRNLPSTAREWRTVLVPPLVGKTEIKEIASLLPKDAVWIFSPFQNKACLSKDYTFIKPYSQEEMQSLTDFAQHFIPGARLRA